MQARLLAHIGKRAVAVVVIELVRQRLEIRGGTDIAGNPVEAKAAWVILHGPIDIVTYVKVRITIPVQITPGGACAPQIVGQPGLLRDLHEAAAALAVRLVVKKRQPAPAGHQQIRPTVSVIIRDGTAVGVKAGTVEAGFARDIAKAPVPKILE